MENESETYEFSDLYSVTIVGNDSFQEFVENHIIMSDDQDSAISKSISLFKENNKDSVVDGLTIIKIDHNFIVNNLIDKVDNKEEKE